MSRTVNWVTLGDSITAGYTNGSISYVNKCQDTYAPLVGHTENISVPGSTCDNFNQVFQASLRFDPSTEVNIASVAFGANDGFVMNATTFLGNLKTACLTLRSYGFTIIVVTMLPCGNYDSQAFRTDSRAMILADPSFWDAVADFGDITTVMGAEAAKGDSTLYNDTVHPSDLGHTHLGPEMLAAIQLFTEDAVVTSGGVSRSRMQLGM